MSGQNLSLFVSLLFKIVFGFGFFGSMIANLILLAAIFFLQKEVGSVVNLMNKELIIIMVAFVMVCGILLSLVSSWMSVARYLNKDMNDLYN